MYFHYWMTELDWRGKEIKKMIASTEEWNRTSQVPIARLAANGWMSFDNARVAFWLKDSWSHLLNAPDGKYKAKWDFWVVSKCVGSVHVRGREHFGLVDVFRLFLPPLLNMPSVKFIVPQLFVASFVVPLSEERKLERFPCKKNDIIIIAVIPSRLATPPNGLFFSNPNRRFWRKTSYPQGRGAIIQSRNRGQTHAHHYPHCLKQWIGRFWLLCATPDAAWYFCLCYLLRYFRMNADGESSH